MFTTTQKTFKLEETGSIAITKFVRETSQFPHRLSETFTLNISPHACRGELITLATLLEAVLHDPEGPK